jgi:hypothetical protein
MRPAAQVQLVVAVDVQVLEEMVRSPPVRLNEVRQTDLPSCVAKKVP